MHTAPPAPTRRPRLLLVEDEPAVRRSLQLLLSARGFEVRAYGSGPELLADDSSLSAQGLIADYRMPDVDGFVVLKTLRERGWAGAALLITGYPALGLTERAIAAGFDRVIEKPFVEAAFVDAVERLAGAVRGQST